MMKDYIFALFFFMIALIIEWIVWIFECKKKNLFDKNEELKGENTK